MRDDVLIIAVVFGAAIIGDLAFGTIRVVPTPLLNWLGALIGALTILLMLNCLIFLFPLALDPAYLLVQDVLIAGIIGWLVDLPLMMYRNRRAKLPIRRTLWEAASLTAIAGSLFFSLLMFRANYTPTTLPF